MVEVAALQILIEADVASALSGLRNFKREIEMAAGSVSDDMGKITTATREMGRPAKDSQKAITDAFKGVDVQAVKTANTAANETKKVEGFLGKWKMGWVAVGAAAIASLYAVAKSSAVIGGYFREFGWIVGYVFDEIGIAMSPVIEPLLDFLWGCADAFAGLPEPVKAAAGAIIIGGAALVTLIPILALLKTSLATLGIGAIFGGIGAKITVVIAGIKAALASLGVGIGAAFATIGVLVAGATIIWYLYSEGVTKAAGDVIDSWSKAHPILYDLIMGITWPIQMLGAVAVAVMEGDLGAIPGMMKKVWSDSLAHWNSFKAQFSAGLESVKTELESWAANAYNMGVQFIDGLIKGLGDIGAKLWDALKRGLSFVSDNLASWSAGLLGFSPTLSLLARRLWKRSQRVSRRRSWKRASWRI